MLSLKSDTKIPANVDANVHSQTAVGELFIELVPAPATAPSSRTVTSYLPTTQRCPRYQHPAGSDQRRTASHPHGDLKTVIDESYTAIGGLGPELARIVKGQLPLPPMRAQTSTR